MARILVVDDEAVLLQLLQQVLADAGHEVLTESESGQIIPRLHADLPDLMILDLFIGDQTGFDVIEAVRKDPAIAGTPLVLCTGATREVDARRAWLREMKVPVLEKPFDLDDLVQLVASQVAPDGKA